MEDEISGEAHPSLHHTIKLRVKKEERIRLDKGELRFARSKNGVGVGFGDALLDFAVPEVRACSLHPAPQLPEGLLHNALFGCSHQYIRPFRNRDRLFPLIRSVMLGIPRTVVSA